jgi:tyrosyl-tRNA synthetase
VWLKKERLSAYDYWQFWRNTEDADVGRFLRLFTDLPLAEIARLEQLKDAEINDAKKILAFEAVKMAHGADAAQAAADTARETFEGGGKGGDLPTFDFPRGSTPSVIDVVLALGFVATRGEAKRLIEQGGLRLNDIPVADLHAVIGAADIDRDGVARLSAGKKRRALAKAV